MGEGQKEYGGLPALRWFLDHFIPQDNRKIHYALISHWHDDHCNDFDKLFANKQLAPDFVWGPNCYLWPNKGTEFEKIIKTLPTKVKFIPTENPKESILYNANGVKIKVIGPTNQYLKQLKDDGRKITVDSKLRPINNDGKENDKSQNKNYKTFATVQKRTEINDLSLTIKLTFCGKSILFPGDLEIDGWKNLIPTDPSSKEWIKSIKSLVLCDLLKIPHHGSKNIPSSLLDALKPPPQYAVVTYESSVGREYDEFGRNIRNPFETLVCTHSNAKGKWTEELYKLGSSKFRSRVSCTFAFKPNREGTSAIIIPLIYKWDYYYGKPVLYSYIRPSDKSCW